MTTAIECIVYLVEKLSQIIAISKAEINDCHSLTALQDSHEHELLQLNIGIETNSQVIL